MIGVVEAYGQPARPLLLRPIRRGAASDLLLLRRSMAGGEHALEVVRLAQGGVEFCREPWQ